MTERGDSLSAATLLEHQQFLRRLAYRLVGDAQAAEDIAQTTLLAAVERPPSHPNLRAWLAAVARNLASRHHRTRGRLRRRERHAARAERAPSTVDAVVRLETQRRVVDAVLALPPHYRDVIVRRFLEGTKPADIAGDLGRPVENVRTRLKRALQLLRAELDERTDGGRKSWGAALLPLLPAPRAKAATLGVIGMGVRSKLAIVALLLLAIGISVERVVRFDDAATPSRRMRAASNADPQPATQAATVATLPVRGSDAARPKGKYRITTGCPGAKVTLRFHHYGGAPDPSAQTLIADESGVVSCDPPAHPQPLHHISAEARAPEGGRAAGTLPLKDLGKALLGLPVRGGAQTVRGVVVDPDGHALQGARVQCGNQDDTGADGSFELAVPKGSLQSGPNGELRARLDIRHHAHRPRALNLDLPATGPLRIVLERGDSIEGAVRFPDGTPAEGIWMGVKQGNSYGCSTWVQTDTNGHYAPTGLLVGAPHRVYLYQNTHQRPTNTISGYHRPSKECTAGAVGVDFELHRVLVLIRVVDQQRRPFRHAQVRLGSGQDLETVETDEQGFATFVREPGRVPLRAMAPDHLGEREEIVLGPTFGRVTHELVLRRPDATGSLALTVRNSLGARPGSCTSRSGSPTAGCR